ncbi:alpha/beta family hydrolase [Streptomyces sp. TRM 70351]|uniref:alpha/beta hydrolase family protein n=1 Tax=Streptomyces sp. TRM 70351 TaxID=3116552 RepID=UPI002E7BCC02|nr:alpha/beta family hydrolase [Streptomyces sp. TRM 70351]MEE1927663.1 alpha/beta family hydrolase [Streptomyces sp. TRM 70351]
MTRNPSGPSGPPGPSVPQARTVATPAGDARITWHRARRERRVLALGHGAGGGIEARDLRALAAALPEHGVTVALVEQPWRVAGKKVAPAPRTLDAAWRALWPELAAGGVPVLAGGRSAGARVACRTAAELGAAGVVALSFPLHPPGRPERSRAAELTEAGVPTLVVQGGADPFGRPAEFPGLPAGGALVEVPHADHGFAVPRRAGLTEADVARLVTGAVSGWLDRE